MKRYGGLPLVHQPGERWLYDTGSQILGVLIARVSGKTLGAFLGERIFEPLGMKDTGFSVPEAELDRLATCYWTAGGTGGLVVFDDVRGGRFASPPVFESGSGGLVSTVDDYLAFCRMMLNKGTYGRGRILSRPSVELMTTDQITRRRKQARRSSRTSGTTAAGALACRSSRGATICPLFRAGSAGTAATVRPRTPIPRRTWSAS